MIKRRNFIWLVPLLLMLTFPAWRIPVGNFLTPRGGYDPEYGNIDKDAHNFAMETVKITQSKNGRITAEIRAASAASTETPNEYLLEMVDADIFSRRKETTNIVAQSGLFNTETKILTLTEDVVVHKIKDSQKLFTDLLYYDDNQQTVHCPGKTKLTGKGIEVNGTSLDYDIERGHYDIGGRVLCLIFQEVTP